MRLDALREWQGSELNVNEGPKIRAT